MAECACGSGKDFDVCCGPVLKGETPAAFPEAVMRARYTAYATGELDYLRESLMPEARADFDEQGVSSWSGSAEWKGLEILDVSGGTGKDDTGEVEFKAHYAQSGVDQSHHERASFRKVDGVWLYEEGEVKKPQPVRRETPKVGRNESCPCGSGKKYKKCCG